MKNIKWSELHPNLAAKKMRFKGREGFVEPKSQSDFDFYGAYFLWQQWFMGGQSVYLVSKELVELFVKTDVSNIVDGMIKLPFNTFYIKFEDAFLGFDGLYISSHSTLDEVHGFSLSFTRQTSLVDLPQFSITLESFETIGDLIKFWVEDWDERITKEGIINEDIKSRVDAVNLAINCILYLSLPQADIKKEYPTDVPTGFIDRLKKAKNKTQKEVAQRTISNAGYSIINLVGSSFAKSHATSDETRTVATHWRRGHWRNQPYLNGDKKLIWIMPVIVNAKTGQPTKGHIYKS